MLIRRLLIIVFLVAFLIFGRGIAIASDQESRAEIKSEKPKKFSRKVSWICDADRGIVVKLIVRLTESKLNEPNYGGSNWLYFIGQRKGRGEDTDGIYLFEKNPR